MRLKSLYYRFRVWQKNPVEFGCNRGEIHHCTNCGEQFEGNFCPVCGQKYTTGRVNWNSIGQDLMNLSGVNSQSLFSTLLQLLGRPGYLIADYCKGRRQQSFPPLAILFLLAAIYTLVLHFTRSNSGIEVIQFESPYITWVCGWMMSNPGWVMLIISFFYTIPTWLLFHYSPRFSLHSFPESIYIQFFMCSLVLIFGIIDEVTSDWVSILLMAVYYYFAYRQLFGYGIWGTLWRTLVCLSISLYFIILVAFAIVPIVISDDSLTHAELIFYYFFLFFLFSLGFCILIIGHFIGKRTAIKRESLVARKEIIDDKE